MLGKLIKYEFKATARTFLPAYALLLILSVIGRVLQNFDQLGQSLVAVIAIVLIVIAFCAVAGLSIGMVLERFWKNLLGREGYLMHTLPASAWQHISAKLITGLLWCIASYIVGLAAVIILAGDAINISIGDMFVLSFRDLIAELKSMSLLGGIIRFLAELFCLTLVGFCALVLMVYLAMCIGQLFNSNRSLAAFGALVGISVLLSLLQELLSMLVPDSAILVISNMNIAYGEALTAINNAMLWAIGEYLLLAVVCFGLTNWLLSKKLNLK